MENNLLKKFLSFSVGGYINIFIGLLIVPITTRLLSPEQYGIVSLITTFVNVLGVVCYLGMDQGFVRFFYEEKEEDRGKLLYESLFFSIFFMLFFSFFIFIFRDQISIFILRKKEAFIWKILILFMIFTNFNRFSLLIIRMQQKGKLYSFFNVLSKILEFFFILLLYKKYGNDYKTIILATLFSLIVVTILGIIVEKKIWRFKNKIRAPRKELLKYSIPLSLTAALSWLFESCDKIVIKLFSNLSELGLYSGAFKIVALMTIIQTGFTTFWTPVAFEHYSKYPEDTYFFKKALDYLAIVFFTLGIGILSTRNLVMLLLGNSYYKSIFIMPMLIFIPVMYLLSEVTMIGIDFKKKSKYFLYISITVTIINLLGNILLVPYLGAKGAAISTAVSYILFFYLRTFFSNKLINFEFDLKRVYLIIFLLFIYALLLSFYDNILFTILIGMLLEILVLLIYLPTLKEVYFKYIKSIFN